MLENLQTSMSHLILQPKTKLLLQTLVTLPMLHPQLFQKGILSRSSINGVLLFGPPGTGKTMLAKALAKSSGAKFMAVSLSDIFDKYVGEGEKNVRAIFTLARKLSPCVIFLDEVDALFGARRQNESSASRREIMNEFMQEWDGIASNNDGIVVLGATNRPFDLDDAILRRMPRRVLVDLPSEKARKKILEVNLDGEALDDTIDIANLAKRTELYSGSDLKNMCVAAALAKVKDDLVSHHLGDSLKDISEVDQKALIQKRVSEIEDYSHVNDLTEIKISDLSLRHFEIALKEVGASLTDDTATLVELRKWDGIYGDGAKGRGKKPDWGFGYLKK